jgi:predicted acylesterase/phospholipase RssA
LINPRWIAGLANLITRGGVYRGEKVQTCVRDLIRKDTTAGLKAILSRLDKQDRRSHVKRLVEIGLLRRDKRKYIVTQNITFAHMQAISKLPGSQFKEYYTTAVDMNTKQMIVLNAANTPDLTLHQAIRFAITLPFYYQPKYYQGHKYIDGGLINNAPVDLATPKAMSRFAARHGVTDNLARLSVRVEYPEDYKNHLWNKPPRMGFFSRVLFAVKRTFAKIFTAGIDFFNMDAVTTRTMQDDFAQRTLQLEDYGITIMERRISDAARSTINDNVPVLMKNYFDIHASEKAVIKHYRQPDDELEDVNLPVHEAQYMPMDVRIKLIKHLEDKKVKFDIPDKTDAELEALRMSELERIRQLDSTRAWQQEKLRRGDSRHILEGLGVEKVEIRAAQDDKEKEEASVRPEQLHSEEHVYESVCAERMCL